MPHLRPAARRRNALHRSGPLPGVLHLRPAKPPRALCLARAYVPEFPRRVSPRVPACVLQLLQRASCVLASVLQACAVRM